MNTIPKVSVITACYKSGEFLHETIDSVLQQTLQDFEIICVDDCSPDETWNILLEYKRKDSRVKIIKMSQNGGFFSIPANVGLAQSSGKYVMFIGHDDMLTSDTLELCYERAKETGADAVFPITEAFDHQTKEIVRVKRGLYGDVSAVLTNREAVILSLDWQLPGNGFWNGDMVRRLGLCELGMNGDEFSHREFLFNSNKVVFSDGTYRYRLIETSITHNPGLKVLDIFVIHKRLLDFLISQNFNDKVVKKYKQIILNSYKYIYMGFFLKGWRRYNQKQRSFADKEMEKIYYNLSLRKLSSVGNLTTRILFRSFRVFCYLIPIEWAVRYLFFRLPIYIIRKARKTLLTNMHK